MNPVTRVVRGGIRVYQVVISPFLPPACRFHPTCSEYALEALEIHGLWRGLGLSIRRLLKCHPWNEGGVDPVPRARDEA